MSNQQDLTLFERYLIEAPEDEEAPDANMDVSNDGPPEAPAEDPPAIDGTTGDDNAGDLSADPEVGEDPPDMGDFNTDDMDAGSEEGTSEEDNAPAGLDAKVSAILNQTLYKQFLSLLNQIASQQTSIRNNSDILYTISADVAGIVKSLSKLEENIRMYLKNTFADENYSRNLLFFDKVVNLLKLHNDSFDAMIRKGMKEQ